MLVKPDWSHWQQVPEAEIRECAALSLNFEPREVTGPSVEWGWDDPEDLSEYERRLDILTRHISCGSLAVKAVRHEPTGDYASDHMVALAEFVSWAQERKWDMPEGLTSLGAPNNSAILDVSGLLDPDADDYPELLAIAYRAWYAASKDEVSGLEGKPKQRIMKFLVDRYPEATNPKMTKNVRNAIALICNWQRKGGRPAGQ